MKIIETQKTKIFSWVKNLEQETIRQMEKIADLPFTEWCALMPDAHPGYDMPIGGVVATKDVIVPNFVGVDISCGMLACKTNLKKEQISDDVKKELLQKIERRIPLGLLHNSQHRKRLLKEKYYQKFLYSYQKNKIEECEHIPFEQDYNFSKQENIANVYFDSIGTLGSGNHFLELQHDEDDKVWIMIHSGSRNLGYKTCDYFNKKAKEQCEKWFSKSEIAFLPTDSKLGKEYINWMNFCMDFSYQNRIIMLVDIEEMLNKFFDCKMEDKINIHHNYARIENHMGKNLWIHRKGATLAQKDKYGIIPGSMGTVSYIVEGRDTEESKLSLNSCSHGAGRKRSRKAFNNEVNTDEKYRQAVLNSVKHVCHSKFKRVKRGRKTTNIMDYSEAPDAYKDIYDVMRNQKELVDVVYMLKPLICIKG